MERCSDRCLHLCYHLNETELCNTMKLQTVIHLVHLVSKLGMHIDGIEKLGDCNCAVTGGALWITV